MRSLGLDALRGLAILLMCLSGIIPKTLPNWMDHGYNPHYKPDATGEWQKVEKHSEWSVPFEPRWKAYTWVDWVFPGFLFAMGAAIPLALRPRIDAREKWYLLIGMVFLRWLALIAFAFFTVHIQPAAIAGSDDLFRRMLALVGFVLAFALYVRFPREVPARVVRFIRIAAIASIVLLIIGLNSREGQSFKWSERDDIIMVLAHCYLIASLAWLALREWPWVRFAVLLPLVITAHLLNIGPGNYRDWQYLPSDRDAAVINATASGDESRFTWEKLDTVFQAPVRWLNVPATVEGIRAWSANRSGSDAPAWLTDLSKRVNDPSWKYLLNFSPLWNFTYYKYLIIVVVGSMAGDWLLRWARAGGAPSGLTNGRSWALIALPFLICAATFAGFRHYGYPAFGIGGPLATPYLAVVLTVPLVIALLVVVWPSSRSGSAHFPITLVGTSFLLVGVALAVLRVPAANDHNTWIFFEGGISKGSPSTLSYYAVAIGSSMLLLIALVELIDIRGYRKSTSLLIANGQNPLLAYYVIKGTAAAIFGMALLSPWQDQLPRMPSGGQPTSLDALFGVAIFTTPWGDFTWGAIKTLLIAAFVWMCTKLRLVWRA